MPAAETVLIGTASVSAGLVGAGVGFDSGSEAGFRAGAVAGVGAGFEAGLSGAAAAGFFAPATDIGAGAIDASCDPAPSARSLSAAGCRTVMSAAAASTHAIPTTIARQLYAFGGGGICGSGVFSPAVFLAVADVRPAADTRARVRFNRSDSLRSEIFRSRWSALSR
jgi:hypothetical protein